MSVGFIVFLLSLSTLAFLACCLAFGFHIDEMLPERPREEKRPVVDEMEVKKPKVKSKKKAKKKASKKKKRR